MGVNGSMGRQWKAGIHQFETPGINYAFFSGWGCDLMSNLVQEPVLDIYKLSLEWKHRVYKIFLKSDVYLACKRTEQEMQIFRPSMTCWTESNKGQERVIFGPVLHSHLAPSGFSYCLINKLETYSLNLRYVCALFPPTCMKQVLL